MKILTVVGARPQFIKASTVSRAIAERAQLTEVLVHTGQHYDQNMSDVFFEELGIPNPAYHLGIGSGSHGVQTGLMLPAVESVILRERPDIVLVYGDTNSTLAGGLAAAKLRVPVAHVEAGLRSFNRGMPEEINRILVDHLSAYLFAPTESAGQQLLTEGFPPTTIHIVGDVMFDASRFFASKEDLRVLETAGLCPGEYVLATIHRAENTDDPTRLHNITEALLSIADRAPILFPVHPRTSQALGNELACIEAHPNIRVAAPLSYLAMIAAERYARLVVTDSGGVQKEAFFFGVPCVTLRTETEWVELVELGWNTVLPPTSSANIASGIAGRLDAPLPKSGAQPFGDGNAAFKIVDILARFAGTPA